MDPINEAYKSSVNSMRGPVYVKFGDLEFKKDGDAYITRASYDESNETWIGYYEIRIETEADRPTHILIYEYPDKKFKGSPTLRSKGKAKSRDVYGAAREAFKKLGAKIGGLRWSNKSLQYKDNIKRYEQKWGFKYRK